MFAGIVKAVKVVGVAKAMLDSVDDDVDLDGVSEVDELKGKFESCVKLGKQFVELGKRLFAELKDAWVIVLGLINHVAKAK